MLRIENIEQENTKTEKKTKRPDSTAGQVFQVEAKKVCPTSNKNKKERKKFAQIPRHLYPVSETSFNNLCESEVTSTLSSEKGICHFFMGSHSSFERVRVGRLSCLLEFSASTRDFAADMGTAISATQAVTTSV